MKKKFTWNGYDALIGDQAEEFANRQGYTFGSEADTLQRLIDATNLLYIQGIISDAERMAAGKRIGRRANSLLLILPEGETDGRTPEEFFRPEDIRACIAAWTGRNRVPL